MKRQVIQLPPQQDESAYKVELLIGQTLEVDCNRHRLGSAGKQNPGRLGLRLFRL